MANLKMLKADLSLLSSIKFNKNACLKANTETFSIEFTIPKLIARLMSSKFESIYESDKLVDYFDFHVDSNIVSKCCANMNEHNEEIFFRKTFDKMVKVFTGLSVDVSLGECELITEIAKSLGSNVTLIPPEVELNNNNCCEIIRFFMNQESIDYAAKNIEFLDEEEIAKLEPNELANVLNSEKLKVSSEDILLDKLIRYIELRGYEHADLISNVEIRFLGAEGRKKYVSFIDKVLTSLNIGEGIKKVWSSVGSFITGEYPKGNRFHESDDLQMVPGMNVEIKASSQYYPDNETRNIEGFNKQPKNYNYFASDNKQNSWIMWEFPQEVRIKSYEVECRSDEDLCHPRNWKIEVSLDKTNWEVVDEQQNHTMLTLGQKKKYNVTPKAVKYFKITQIGVNSNNNYYFCLKRVLLSGWYYWHIKG